MPLTCIPGSVLCGLGLPEILLWLLVFAIVFGILSVIQVFKNKRINALIALVLAFFVLMAAPLSLITVITSLTNSFVTLTVVIIVLMALLAIAGVYTSGDKEGVWQKNAKWIALALVLIALVVFMGAGGLAFIGISSLPSIAFSSETIALILVGIAVLWLVFSEDKPKATG